MLCGLLCRRLVGAVVPYDVLGQEVLDVGYGMPVYFDSGGHAVCLYNGSAVGELGFVVRGNYEEKQALKNALEIYDSYPEQTKDSPLVLDLYDRIIMNPPFEKGQDIDHVRRAYDMLHPNGRIVAIMSEGPFYRSDSKAQEFRAWLDDKGGTSEKLPEGSFKDSDRSTGVNTRLVIIDKPDDVRFRVEDADGVAVPENQRMHYTPTEKYSARQKVFARNVKRIMRESFGDSLNLKFMDVS